MNPYARVYSILDLTEICILLVFNVCMLIFIVIGQVAMTLTDDGHKIKPCKIICHLRLHTQSLATSWHILKNIPYKRKIEIESP